MLTRKRRKTNDELTELETIYSELKINVNESCAKVNREDDWRSESVVFLTRIGVFGRFNALQSRPSRLK